ncbi:MAG: Uroporphyrinogen-III synthase [Bacteroidota bacterium]|jgi:uroporphyrinogen-III synthase
MAHSNRILSTKVLLPHQLKALTDAGLEVVAYDFIQVEAKQFDLNGIKDNLIFTSQNAVQSFFTHPQFQALQSELIEKKVFCVGMKSKNSLTEAGFDVVAYTDYASDLAEIITLVYANERYTFFSGNLRKATLPDALTEAGIEFNELEVYETQLNSHKTKGPFDALLFFSPSGVESYLKENKIKKEVCFCIGETTAEALVQITKNCIVAEHPSIEAVLEDVLAEYN